MSKKSNRKRLLASAAALAMICTAFPLAAFADETESDGSSTAAAENSTGSSEDEAGFSKQKTYSEYYDEIADKPRPAEAGF